MLSITHAVEEQAGLSSGRSHWIDLPQISRKDLYSVVMKVLNCPSLVGVGEWRWVGVLAPLPSPRDSWTSQYKPPTEKWTADLQWGGDTLGRGY